MIRRTISEDMLHEARYLRSHNRARAAIKEVLEMPDAMVDRVIRSAEANKNKLSGALLAEIPALGAPGRWEAIIAALQESFADAPPLDEIQAYKPQRPAG